MSVFYSEKDNFLKQSRDAHFKEMSEAMFTLFRHLNSHEIVDIDEVRKKLKIDPLLLINPINAMFARQGFKVICTGHSLSLEKIDTTYW